MSGTEFLFVAGWLAFLIFLAGYVVGKVSGHADMRAVRPAKKLTYVGETDPDGDEWLCRNCGAPTQYLDERGPIHPVTCGGKAGGGGNE